MSISVFEERHSKIVDELLQSDPIKSENLEKSTGNEVQVANEAKAGAKIERVHIIVA